MILTRLGNKRKLAAKLLPHFPPHEIYVEPFFGAGGMFFNKPKAKYNILNDLDREVFNLFNCVLHCREQLEAAWVAMPVHQELWDRWRKGEVPEDPILRACRFLFLSNFGFLGKAQTMRYMSGNTKRLVLDRMDNVWGMLWDAEFGCQDFRELFRRIPALTKGEQARAFIYADPPYLGCAHNYQSGFTAKDCADLFSTLQGTGARWAMSEFDHPEIIALAASHALNVLRIGERKNLKNRRVEILITNYQLEDKE